MSTTKVRNFILKNHTTMSKTELANGLKVETKIIIANFARLKREGKIAKAVILKNKAVIDSVMSEYELAKKNKANTYNNHDGENKEKARTKIVKYILDSKVNGVIPTLPNTKCVIEKKLLSSNKNLSFIGVECDKITFDVMSNTIKKEKLPIKPFFGYMGAVLFGILRDTYAHLILDYCGMLPTFAKEIEYSIKNNTVKVGGIIAMTFAKPIRATGGMFDDIIKLGNIKTNNTADNRCMSDRAIEAYMHKITGDNYELIEIFNYNDLKEGDKKTYPMTLVIVKRIR